MYLLILSDEEIIITQKSNGILYYYVTKPSYKISIIGERIFQKFVFMNGETIFLNNVFSIRIIDSNTIEFSLLDEQRIEKQNR